MEHQQAIELGAVDKYLLNELPDPQRAQFEEHYFGCQDCAADLRMTSEFLALARKELKDGNLGRVAPKTLKRSWFELFARPAVLTPAFALLLGVIAYQNGVVLPRHSHEIAVLSQPGIVTPVSLIGGNSRGGSAPEVSGGADHALLLSFDIPPMPAYPSYACLLVDAAGSVIWRVPVSGAQAQDTVSINVPASALRNGDYTLVVQGIGTQDRNAAVVTKGTDLARYRFVVGPTH